MSAHGHRGGGREVGFAVITVSDTRNEENDASGAAIIESLEGRGHRLVAYEIVPDDATRVADAIARLSTEARAVVLSGGTGIAPRDNTYEAVCGLLDKRLDGFGELFRMLSYREIGSAAMASRAVAGVVGTTLVFALPGATAACRLGSEELIGPELGHLSDLLMGDDGRSK